LWAIAAASNGWGPFEPVPREAFVNRSRFAVSVVIATTSTFWSLNAAEAAGPYLKLKADKETVAADQPVRLTLTAVSTRSLRLPAPVLAVDDGGGFRERPELACAGEAASPSDLTPDKAVVTSCELKVERPGKTRLRLEYRLPDGVVRSNPVTISVGGDGKESASK
jgi:hypothetical protein